MIKISKFCSKILLAPALIACLSGCQQLGGMYDKLTKRNSVTPQPQSQTAKQNWTKPLKPEEKIDVQMAVAHSLAEQGENEQAIKVYQEIIKKDSKRADAYHQLALALRQKGRPAGLRKILPPRDSKKSEKIPFYWLTMVIAATCKNDGRKPNKIFVKHWLWILNSPGRITTLAYSWLAPGREEQALKEFARTGAGEADARSNLGHALLQENHWAAAQEQFEIALVADPNSKKAKNGLSTLQKLAPEISVQQIPDLGFQSETKTTQASFVVPK